MRKFENGFIYHYILKLAKLLDHLNLVEHFKNLVLFIVKRKKSDLTSNDDRYWKSIAIDVFVLMKYILLLTIWILGINNIFINIGLWYLVITTVWTYFKYHFWRKDDNKSYHRMRRRFISLALSLVFITMSFSYFIDIGYEDEFSQISEENVYVTTGDYSKILLVNDIELPDIDYLSAIKHSFSNAFIGDFSSVKPVTENGETILILQSLISFIYLALILTKSIFE